MKELIYNNKKKMRRKKNFLTHILTCRIIIKQVLKMSSQYHNKPIQEQEICKKNSLIKIWKPLQPQLCGGDIRK
jgi:hypothetical protein